MRADEEADLDDGGRPGLERAMTEVSVDPQAPVAPAATGRLSPTQRAALGRAARTRVPRSSHADPGDDGGRPDPLALLEGQAESRVPELVPIRHGRMASSPFAYYRGAALPMAADLARTPTSGIQVQACGDAHLLNFGVYKTPERSLVFDINDFDETLPGPWEWDVKRLAASLVVAGRERGFSQQAARLGRPVRRRALPQCDGGVRGDADARRLVRDGLVPTTSRSA